MFKLAYTQTAELSKDEVSDLISTAFEGGSNYWAEVQGFIVPKEVDFRCRTFANDTEPHRLYDYPLCTGGAVVLSDKEGDYTNKHLDLESIRHGLELLAERHPKVLDRIVQGDYDADDADIFLQLALLGEVVFG